MLKVASLTFGGRPWTRKKQSGLWRECSWRDGHDRVRAFSLGLTGLGFREGEMLGIIGDSDPQWFWAEIAAQAAGGSALGISSAWPAAQTAAALRQFGARFVAVQDRQQVDKLLQIRGDVPGLEKVIYWSARGIEADRESLLVSFDRVAEAGLGPGAPGDALDERIARVKPSDGAITRCDAVDGSAVRSTAITHESLLDALKGLRSMDPAGAADRWFSGTPPEGMVEQTAALAGSLASGMSIDFPENRETVQQDLREVGSSLLCYPSAAWEGLAATVKDRIEKTTPVKRLVAALAGRAPRPLAEFAFYRPLRARIGLANTRCVYSFGPELTPGTLKALLDMGLNVRQLDVCGGAISIRPAPGGGGAAPKG